MPEADLHANLSQVTALVRELGAAQQMVHRHLDGALRLTKGRYRVGARVGVRVRVRVRARVRVWGRVGVRVRVRVGLGLGKG